MLFFSRNESETCKPSNMRMMSRFWRAVFGNSEPGCARWRRLVSSTISYFVNPDSRDRRRAEKTHDRAARPHHPDDLPRQRLRGGLVEEVEVVPAQKPIDALVGMAEPVGEEARQRLRGFGANVAIDVGAQILDEQLAAEALAEKSHVRADDRTEVHQHWRFRLRQRREKLRQRLRRHDNIVAPRTSRWRT